MIGAVVMQSIGEKIHLKLSREEVLQWRSHLEVAVHLDNSGTIDDSESCEAGDGKTSLLSNGSILK